MKKRLAVLAVCLLALGSTSAVIAASPAGATVNCATLANKFRLDPTPARMTTAGEVGVTLTGRCLVPGGSYTLHLPSCGFGDITATADLSGTLTGGTILTGCSPGTYFATATENFGAHKVVLLKHRITSPAACPAGSAPTITALPSNAPRMFGTDVSQTVIGECYPAFAPVTVNFTACGGSVVTATTDAFGRFYIDFFGTPCTGGSYPITVTANYPPVGSILATGIQKIDP